MFVQFVFLSLLYGCTVLAETQGKAFQRFFTIWLENQDFAKVSVNADIKELSKQGILLTNYYGLTHPSQPNYIASISGDHFGLNHDDFVRIPQNVSTVVDLFDTKGITWKGYFEGIPGPGYMGIGSTAQGGNGWDYVRKHNPFVHFDSINHNGTRLANVVSFRDFGRDLFTNKLPQYGHMSPNMLNDGHNTTLDFAATWTKTFLMPLLNDENFMKDNLILLTYDESETYSIPNKIVSVLLGGAVPKNLRGTTDDTFYTHYSILSTLENNWELPNLGRYDVGANVFSLVADKTGYKNIKVDPLKEKVDLSVSYSGFLNAKSTNWKGIPPPNLQLVGAGGKEVAMIIRGTWKDAHLKETPYSGDWKVYDAPNPPVYRAQGPKLPTLRGGGLEVR